jgi:cobalamin biosynthesis protein CbiD
MAISGRGGLGVFGLEGLVKPVSLVRSAVEAKLMLLTRERRRWVLVMGREIVWGV